MWPDCPRLKRVSGRTRLAPWSADPPGSPISGSAQGDGVLSMASSALSTPRRQAANLQGGHRPLHFTDEDTEAWHGGGAPGQQEQASVLASGWGAVEYASASHARGASGSAAGGLSEVRAPNPASSALVHEAGPGSTSQTGPEDVRSRWLQTARRPRGRDHCGQMPLDAVGLRCGREPGSHANIQTLRCCAGGRGPHPEPRGLGPRAPPRAR